MLIVLVVLMIIFVLMLLLCFSLYIWKFVVFLCYKNYEDIEKWLDVKIMCIGYGVCLVILDIVVKLSSVFDGKFSKIFFLNDLKIV